MTAPLNHPLYPASAVDPKAIEAAMASLSYWNQPAPVVAEPKAAPADLSPLDQMYAYFD